MSEKKTLSFAVEPEIIEKLDRIAAARKWSRAFLVKELLRGIVNNPKQGEKCLQLS